MKNEDKKAKQFDLEEILLEAQKTAKERCFKNEIKDESSEDEVDFNNLALNSSENSDDESCISKSESESDSDYFGPLPINNTEQKPAKQNKTINYKMIPIKNSISIMHGKKAVSAMALDSIGNRLAIGSFDFDVSLWNFTTMDSSLRNYRKFTPCESHQIRSLAYDCNNERILVAPGSAQAKVLTKEGIDINECIKGDQYIMDMGNTKGHVAMLNCGVWNPIKSDEFITTSNDCTLRIWDVETMSDKHKSLIRFRNAHGTKTIPMSCVMSQDGNLIMSACTDGTIQVWDVRRRFVYPVSKIKNAHLPGMEAITSVVYSYDNALIGSRGGIDCTLKVWDTRKLLLPLMQKDKLESIYSMTSCVFSPNDKYITTCSSINAKDSGGTVLMYNVDTAEETQNIKFNKSVPIKCIWHPRLNQILVGCSNGKINIFYDPDISINGATLFIAKKPKEKKSIAYVSSQKVYTPFAHPLFKEQSASSIKRNYEKTRKNKALTMHPEPPVDGPGSGGRLAKKGGTLSRYVVQQLCLKNDDVGDRNPREAILKHAKEAKENPKWIAPAYKTTQPIDIFQKRSANDASEPNDESQNKKTKYE